MSLITLIGATLILLPGFADPFLASKGIFLMLSVSVFLGIAFLQKKSLQVPSRKFLCLWGALGVLSLLSASDPFATIQLWTIALAVCFYSASHRDLPEKELRYAVWGLGLAQIAVGIAQILLISDPSTFNEFPQRLKFAGTLGNPQYVASFLGIGICLALFEKNKKVWHWMIAGALVCGLALTRAQGTSLCLLVVLIAFGPFSKKQRWFIAGFAIIGLATLAPQLHWHTFRGRLLLWVAAVKMTVGTYGWGVGLGQFGNHYLEVQREVLSYGLFSSLRENAAFADHPHNEYLALLAELGLLSVGLVWFFMSRFDRRKLTPTFTAILCFVSIDALFSFPWRLVPVLLVIGLVVVRALPERERIQGWPLAVLSSFFLLVSFAGIALQYGEGRADYLARHGHIPKAERYVDWALQISPHKPELLLLKGRLRYLQFDPKNALRWARRANETGERIDSLKLEGLALMDLRQWVEAEALYRRLLDTLPEQVTAHYYLAEIYLRQNRLAEAKREYSLLSPRKAKNAKAVIDQWRSLGFL